MQPYELIRSGRRTLALEVRGGHVIVRAPVMRTCVGQSPIRAE